MKISKGILKMIKHEQGASAASRVNLEACSLTSHQVLGAKTNRVAKRAGSTEYEPVWNPGRGGTILVEHPAWV